MLYYKAFHCLTFFAIFFPNGLACIRLFITRIRRYLKANLLWAFILLFKFISLLWSNVKLISCSCQAITDLNKMKMMMFVILVFSLRVLGLHDSSKEGCNLRPVIHMLKHFGCLPKPIPSFACQGSCSSYVQVSFWCIYVYTYFK